MSIDWGIYNYRRPFSSAVFFVPCLVFVLVSCSSERTGLNELRKLCEKDAGLRIFRTVEAEGYYDAYAESGIADKLVTEKYNFYEFCDDSPSLSKSTAIPEPGCWRVKRVERSLGLCYERIDRMLAKVVVEPYPEFLKKYCIAVERLEKPTARYSYRSGRTVWPAKDGVAEFSRSYAKIEVSGSDELLSEYVTYAYNKMPRYSSPQNCHVVDQKFPTYVESNLVGATIISNKEREND